MIKTLKNLLLQNQESFKAEYSIMDSRSTKFVQMLTLGWPLTFLQQGQICDLMHLYEENVEKSFFYVLSSIEDIMIWLILTIWHFQNCFWLFCQWRAISRLPKSQIYALPILPSFRPIGTVGEACLQSNAYYPRTPDYTLYSGVHVCWSDHSDLSFVYGFMSLEQSVTLSTFQSTRSFYFVLQSKNTRKNIPPTNNPSLSTPLRRQREAFWIRELGTAAPYGCNDKIVSVGNLTSPRCSSVNVMSLFGSSQRRKGSHAHRHFNRPNFHADVAFDTLLPYVAIRTSSYLYQAITAAGN